jgi:hypothetical protein
VSIYVTLRRKRKSFNFGVGKTNGYETGIIFASCFPHGADMGLPFLEK